MVMGVLRRIVVVLDSACLGWLAGTVVSTYASVTYATVGSYNGDPILQ